MGRNRVLSFMSQWGGRGSPTHDTQQSERPTPSPLHEPYRKPPQPSEIDTATPRAVTQQLDASAPNSPSSPSTPSRARADSKPRRLSMLQAYNPPQVEVANDTPPELQPIFTFLNSHSNKLYQEGYFLKLHDLDARGRPSSDRIWSECFAQLIGTVLSLWDAAALDVAGEDAEVMPTFINLSDATIKMIESLPMSGAQGGNLQNVLSISTAANNRYLLHFNTLNSLTQWTAGVRLAMFEHATLQEAYTGSLIAGKGRNLNNIKQIMYPLKFAHEDWARVRFGAGTPWRRCWCVISPPDEKELEKAKKAAKKASPYEKMKMPRGDIKFYDTKKVNKKTRPIATITECFAAYAIYPQSKPLIEQSTLVKVEGVVSIEGRNERSEGFVFVMPEVHQAITGFEIMLRWLFPAFDTFNLYGRPTKLIADTLDQRGLMFAMPTSRRYGYLDILDVSSLIHTKGSQGWTERQWRRELKKLTAERMTNHVESMPRTSSHDSRRRNTETTRPGVRFGDGDATRSTPGSRTASPSRKAANENVYPVPPDSAPPGRLNMLKSSHKRATSEAQGLKRFTSETPSRTSYEAARPGTADGPFPSPPPQHGYGPGGQVVANSIANGSRERVTDYQQPPSINFDEAPPPPPHLSPPEPVGRPPAFMHSPNSRPTNSPYSPPELRRANSNVDAATLQEMREAQAMQERQEPAYQNGTWNGVVTQRPQTQQNMVASQQMSNWGVPADRSQGAMNRLQHVQRLSTIPASPFVPSEGEYFGSPKQASATTPMEEVKEVPDANLEGLAITESDSRPGTSDSSKSITRKPVPPRELPEPPQSDDNLLIPDNRPHIPRSLTDPTNSPLHVGDSWEHIIINEVALEEQLNASERDRASTLRSIATTESTEPDYASTASASTKPKRSVDRPRMGKLKSVGNADIPTFVDPAEGLAGQQQNGRVATASDLPDVNFGPTYDYTRMIGSHPRADLTMDDRPDPRRSRSVDMLDSTQKSLLSRAASPSASKRLSYFTSSPNDSRRQSYFNNSPSESKRNSYFDGTRTPTQGGRTPTPGGFRTPEPLEDRSQVMWPGASPGASSPYAVGRSKSVSPEQWVQQRAAMAQNPQYAPPKNPLPERVLTHQRSSSLQNPAGRRKLTKTPPLTRHRSGDWGSQTPPPMRPSSRGAGVNLDTAGRIPSASEQMQISRATGSPLVDLTSNSKKLQDAQSQQGMIGIVGQRERDKIASREGRNSMLVQHAIERQQQQARMEAEALAQYQYDLRMRQQQEAYQQHQQQMAWNQQQYMQNQQYAASTAQMQQQQWPLYQQPSTYQPTMRSENLYQSTYAPAASSVYSSATEAHQHQQQQQQHQSRYGQGYMAQQQQQYGRR